MKKFLCHRFVLGFLFLLAFLAAGVVLWYSVTAFQGRREWDAAQKALAARGEKLSIRDFVPPPLADDLNFAAAPAFAGLFRSDGVPPEETPFDVVKTSLGKCRWRPNERTDLAAAAASYRAEGRVPDDQRPAAEAVLEALAPAQPLMDEMARYAERPGTRFPVRYEDGIHAAMPHLNHLLKMTYYLRLRAAANMELGRSAEAARDLLLLLRMADSLKSEPNLISLLVRFGMLDIATLIVWEGLACGIWDEPQLAALQNRLRGYDLYSETAHALRGERGGVIDFLEFSLRTGLDKFFASAPPQEAKEDPDALSFDFLYPTLFFSWLYPTGWAYSDLAFLSNVFQQWIDRLENRQRPLRPADFEFIEPELTQWGSLTITRHLFSALTLPALTGVFNRTVVVQTRLNEARTAIALERYRLAHGEFPETLAALVPQFLEAEPVDVMTARPFNYRRLASDDFLLWSVGWDATDDHGAPLDRKTQKGDIAWMRLPASARVP